jgi:hypothetical protein
MDQHTDNTDRHFLGQQKTEGVNEYSREHPIVLVPFLFVWLVVTGGLSFGLFLIIHMEGVAQSFWGPFSVLVTVILLTTVQHIFALRVFNYYLDMVILTSYRVINIHKSLFLYDSKEFIDLNEIQDIKKVQEGIWPNLLNYGNLTIHVATMNDPMTLHHIPKPDYYLHKINGAKRDYIAERRRQKYGNGNANNEQNDAYPQDSPFTEINL